MDDLSRIFALTTEFKAHGKTWVIIETIRPMEDGEWVLAVEKNGSSPIPTCLVWKPRDQSPV